MSWGIQGESKKSKWKVKALPKVRQLPWIPTSGGGSAPYPAPLEGRNVPTPYEPAPDDTWTKADIVAWLLDKGIDMSESALMHLTKDELLALTADYLDEETEP